MAKFRRDDDTDEYRPSRSGGNVVLLAVLAAGGLVVLLCAGIAAVGFFTARTAVREAEGARVEVAEQVAQIEAERVAQDGEDVRAFREKVAHYLAEARAAAKLMAGEPTVEDAKEKASHIRNLRADLPGVPPEIDHSGKVAGRLKDIHKSFIAAAEYVRLRHGFAEIGDKGKADEMTERLTKAVADVNAAAAEIGVMVGIKAEP